MDILVALEEGFVVDIPSATDRPEGGEALVLPELRGALIAEDEVERLAVIIDRIPVEEEARCRGVIVRA